MLGLNIKPIMSYETKYNILADGAGDWIQEAVAAHELFEDILEEQITELTEGIKLNIEREVSDDAR